MALQKEDGALHPIWPRCFASLVANATPVRLRSSHLLMITLFKRHVSGMVLPLRQASLVFFLILLTVTQMLLVLKSSD